MRVLIRNLESGKFFKARDIWTENPLEAFNFEDGGAAVATARELGLKQVELHMTSDEGRSLFGKLIETES